MPRFPVKKEQISGSYATISGSDYKHITKVLRLKPGDLIVLFDGNSNEYSGTIKNINQKNILVELIESWKARTESELDINLYQSVIKSSKMDLVVQKSTELGVRKIVPVTTERTQDWIKTKLERLNKISIEAAKQCKRTNPPEISEPINLAEALQSAKDSDLKLIIYEKADLSLKKYLNASGNEAKVISVFIGPEGGYTEKEISLAESYGFKTLGLGKRILRAETAAMVVTALLQYEIGDLA